MPEIPAGVAQVNLKFTGINLPTGAEMTFGVDQAAQTPVGVAGAVCTAWDLSGVQSLQTDETLLASVYVKFGPSLTGPSADVACGLAGVATGAGVHPNTAMLVKKVTPDGGRAGRGRMYMPGMPETVISDSGLVDAGFLGSANTAFEDFRARLNTATIPMILLHGAGSPISLPSVVTSLLVDPKVATQRRRLRR